MNIERITDPVCRMVDRLDGSRAALVGISGIDASGKGWLAGRLREALYSAGVRRVALLGADGWLAPPAVRLCTDDPAGNFYRRGLRLEEMYREVVLPLKSSRSIDVEASLLAETAARSHRSRLVLHDVDVVLLEGIFILKREFQRLFDLAVWVDCSFETALERAVARRQEGLDTGATIAAYQQVYFPAQRIHLAVDDPISATDLTVRNDPRLPPALKRFIHTEAFAA